MDSDDLTALLERLDRIIVLFEWFAERQVGASVSPPFTPRDPFNSDHPRQRWQPLDQSWTDSDPSQD